jgi:hypothetical protein
MNLVFVFINFQGIGDNVRGLINLLQIVKLINHNYNKKINIHVDFSLHLMNDYLIYSLPDELKVKNNHITKFHYSNEDSHDYEIIHFLLQYIDSNNTIYINSNNYPHIDCITEDIKTYMKQLFTFTPFFENRLNESFSQLPNDYDVYHYRLGDEVFKQDIDNCQHIIDSFNNREKPNNVFVISDSLNLKQKIYDIYQNNKVYVLLNQPHHTKDDLNDIHILIDYMLVTKAKNIYCYNTYSWISNFVLWSSYIYDIHLVNIPI